MNEARIEKGDGQKVNKNQIGRSGARRCANTKKMKRKCVFCDFESFFCFATSYTYTYKHIPATRRALVEKNEDWNAAR